MADGAPADSAADGGAGSRAAPDASSAPAAGRLRIYTRTGDGGAASLYTGERRPKDDAVFCALGDVDELNAALGLAAAFCEADSNGLCGRLAEIQSRLLDVGSAVATPAPPEKEGDSGGADGAKASSSSLAARKVQRTRFDAAHVAALESWLDALDDTLPPLSNFILPSGGRASAALHVARATARRAERAVVPLVREGHVEGSVLIYINRLSDYLFTAARYAAKHAGAVETIYKKA